MHQIIDFLLLSERLGPFDKTFVALTTPTSLGEHFIVVIFEFSAQYQTSSCLWIFVFGIIRKSSFASNLLLAEVSWLGGVMRFLEILKGLYLSESFEAYIESDSTLGRFLFEFLIWV